MRLDQLKGDFGASQLLQVLMTGNGFLLSALVDDDVISQLILLLRQRGPARPILDLLGSMCRCQGETVVSNQERLMRVVYSITENQRHIQYRRAMLVETMLLKDQFAVDSSAVGNGQILISWQGIADYEPGILEITALFFDAETIGLPITKIDTNPAELQGYLERAHATNSTRMWVALDQIAWTLDPRHMYPTNRGLHLPGSWQEYQARCRANPKAMQQFHQARAIANYYAGVLALLHEFCSNRSYRCIEMLEKQFSYELLLSAMADQRLPIRYRVLFSNLFYVMYMDRFPYEPMQLPSLVRFDTLSTMEAAPDSNEDGGSLRKLATVQSFITEYFESEADNPPSSKKGTRVDDLNLSHSLLRISHFLLSTGLYNSSNKVMIQW